MGIWRATVSPMSASMRSFFPGKASEYDRYPAHWLQSIASGNRADGLVLLGNLFCERYGFVDLFSAEAMRTQLERAESVKQIRAV